MDNEVWFRWLVWMDYRLALLFTVIIPLILLIWTFVQKADAMQSLLMIYWRVSSLLAITLYLMIANIRVGFISGLMAKILIPLALWFWVDLNDEIDYQQSGPMKLTFTSWRWATTVYCILGALGALPFLGCAFSSEAIATPNCLVWFEAPLLFKQYFHSGSKASFLGFIGIFGLIVYVLCLSYFVLFKLSKQGRSATQ